MISTLQGQVQAIQILKNVVYSWLNNSHPHFVADKQKHNIFQDQRFLVKNFKNISNTLINDTNLLRLDLYILLPNYLEEGVSCFMKVLTKYKESEISDSKKEKKRQMTLQKEMRDAQATTCFATSSLHAFFTAISISGLFVLFASSVSIMPMLSLSVIVSVLVLSASIMLVLGLSALST